MSTLLPAAFTLALLSWCGSLESAEPAPQRVQAPAAISPKMLRYAERVLAPYDLNRNGRLEANEWQAMRGKPELMDANHDGVITREEFAQYIADYSAGRAIRLSAAGADPLAADGSQRRAGEGAEGDQPSVDSAAATTRDPRRSLKYFANLPAGVPPWFVERDTDGDGQLTLSEFSPKLLKAEVDDFTRFDLNRDGILTVQEFIRASSQKAKDHAGSP